MTFSARIFGFLVGVLFLSSAAYAQETVRYTQKDAVKFSNEYIFHPDGRFEHIYRDDDFQVRYGSGTYREKPNEIALEFENDPHYDAEAP
ncbi:MAG: hypothetical protein AAF570_26300, partial [Bacteroidota bacterium]